MKQLGLILLIMGFSIIKVAAQNYQTVSSNQTSYFDNQNKSVQCIRIDSTKFQSDSILYPYTIINQLGDGCFSPSYASWIGKQVSIKQNGVNQFFNKVNDTITIQTNARLGDDWLVYMDADSMKIIATVIAHDTLTFLGLNDSVKTINFQAINKHGAMIDHHINSQHIQVSKNYGFVKTLSFYFFPDFEYQFFGYQCEEFTLIGLSNPEVGIKNLTWLKCMILSRETNYIFLKKTVTGGLISKDIQGQQKTYFSILAETTTKTLSCITIH